MKVLSLKQKKLEIGSIAVKHIGKIVVYALTNISGGGLIEIELYFKYRLENGAK